MNRIANETIAPLNFYLVTPLDSNRGKPSLN